MSELGTCRVHGSKPHAKTDECYAWFLAPLPAAQPTALERQLKFALDNLYALVQGECPSILRDDHHDTMVSEAIAAYEAKYPEATKCHSLSSI